MRDNASQEVYKSPRIRLLDMIPDGSILVPSPGGDSGGSGGGGGTGDDWEDTGED